MSSLWRYTYRIIKDPLLYQNKLYIILVKHWTAPSLDIKSFLFLYFQEYGDDKVQLAIQTYELVDKHIRRLDNDLARFESEIQDKALNSRNQDEPSVGKRKNSLREFKLNRWLHFCVFQEDGRKSKTVKQKRRRDLATRVRKIQLVLWKEARRKSKRVPEQEILQVEIVVEVQRLHQVRVRIISCFITCYCFILISNCVQI